MRPSFRVVARTAVLQVLALPLLALALLLGMASTAQAADDTVVLATESHGEAPGLEPRQATDPDNEFAPPEYEQNFLWGAAVGLGVMVIGGFGAVGGLYWLLVVRPSQAQKAE